jgi:hypothetical protein
MHPHFPRTVPPTQLSFFFIHNRASYLQCGGRCGISSCCHARAQEIHSRVRRDRRRRGGGKEGIHHLSTNNHAYEENGVTSPSASANSLASPTSTPTVTSATAVPNHATPSPAPSPTTHAKHHPNFSILQHPSITYSIALQSIYKLPAPLSTPNTSKYKLPFLVLKGRMIADGSHRGRSVNVGA